MPLNSNDFLNFCVSHFELRLLCSASPQGFEVSAVLMLVAFDNRIDYHLDVLVESLLLRQSLGIVQKRAVLAIESFVRIENLLLLLARQAGPLHSTFINAANRRRIMTAHRQERRDVLIEPGKPGNEAPLAESNELMQADHAAKPCPRLNLAVTA